MLISDLPLPPASLTGAEFVPIMQGGVTCRMTTAQLGEQISDLGIISLSIASSNGFTGTSSSGNTPTLTLGTSITGIPIGNGTAFNAAVAGTDYSSGTSLLGTGILKSTTLTGALTIAIAADFPTLNQNTTGNSATASALIPGANINGVAFTGAANITVASAAGTLTGTTLASNVVTSSLTTVGTIGTGTWSASFGAVSGANLTNLTAANISAGTAGINISGNSATVTTNANLTGAVTSVGNATSLGSFTSANLASALSDETGSGSAVFSVSPALTGTATAAQLVTGYTAHVFAGPGAVSQVVNTVGTQQSIMNWNGGNPALALLNSSGSTVGTHGTLASGNTVGEIDYYADDGTSYTFCGFIRCAVDGAVSSGIVPTRFEIDTMNSSGSRTRGFRVDSAQNVISGTGSTYATTATGGFLTIPVCAGAPTGVPGVASANLAPLIYDSTNHKFWAYDFGASAWKGVALT